MAKKTETRKIVLDILMEYEGGQGKISDILKNSLDKVDYLDRQDKAFISRLTRGCIEREYALDYVIAQYAKTKNGKMKPVIREILRISIYQILFMDGIKDYAACSEAVELAKGRGLSGLTSFVNGVLRNIAREKNNIKWPDKKQDRKKYMTIYYSVPEWIISLLDEQYGMEISLQIMEGIQKTSDLVIRVNEKLPKRVIDECLKGLELTGTEVIRHPYYEYAYIVKNVDNVGLLPGFGEGVYTVQDVSSQLAVHIAGIKEGQIVADLCAAPGGKAAYAGLLAGEKGQVYARDITEEKTDLIRDNADRLGINNLDIKVQDGTIFDESLNERCDVVICDAPCSGLGIMGRKADIRYNVKPESIEELAILQRSILDNAVKYVKPGGVLIYSTCTLTKQENLDNRDYIINELGLEPLSFTELLSDELVKDIDRSQTDSGYLQLLQGVNKSDGFFVSKYIKKY